jgi:hypothetical protein
MIYALSNAGADPNVTDGKGNTPLHEVLMRDSANSELDLIQVYTLIKSPNVIVLINFQRRPIERVAILD